MIQDSFNKAYGFACKYWRLDPNNAAMEADAVELNDRLAARLVYGTLAGLSDWLQVPYEVDLWESFNHAYQFFMEHLNASTVNDFECMAISLDDYRCRLTCRLLAACMEEIYQREMEVTYERSAS